MNSPTVIYISVNNNGKDPNEYGKPMWEALDHELEISSNDPKFLKQGVYYVHVSPRQFPDELPDDLTNYVTYTIKDKSPKPIHTFLTPKIPDNGTINKGESRYFESLLLDDDSPVIINKSGNIDLYISIDPNNKYPNQDSYDFLIKDQQLSLTASEACKTLNPLGCPIYMTAISTEKIPSYFELSMKSASAVTALEEGHEIQLLTPANNRSALFYFHASVKQNSVITVSSPGKEVVIYAKRTKLDAESLDQLWREAPDEDNAEFTSSPSSNSNDTILSIPPLGAGFSLAISVYFKNSEEGQTTYKIVTTSQMGYSFIGSPQASEVKKDHYKYFKFHSLNVKATHIFSLAASAEVGFVISFGENTRPTLSNNHFASISPSKTHIIEINNTDVTPGNSMLGFFIIGVYGHTEASFTLSVAFETQKLMELKPGVPVEMSLKGSSVVYFKYFHEPERNLQINLTQLSGEMNLYASDLVKELPDQKYNKWKILYTSPQRALTIPMEDHKACFACLYIIRIEAVSYQSKFSLVINQVSNILPIQSLFLVSGLLKSQKSVVYMFTSEAQENQINIEFSKEKMIVLGSKCPSVNLTNYLWKETLLTNQSIPLKTQGESYILLHNPTENSLSFSFIITPKLTPLGRLEELYDLAPYEKKFFKYSLPEDAVETEIPMNGYYRVHIAVDVDILFYAAQPQAQESMESFLKKGQKVKALLLPQEPTVAPNDFIFQAESAPKRKSNESHAIVNPLRTEFQPFD